jgi:tetratricopeptide (TPR) repeat protein
MATFQPKITRVDSPRSESAGSVQEHVKAGRAFLEQDLVSDALAEFESGLKLDPNSIPCHLWVAKVKFQQKQLDPALDHLNDVLRLDPMNHRGHLRSAQIHLARRDYDHALESAENAIRISPKLDIAHFCAGHVHLLKNDLPRAKEYLSNALRLNPRSARVRQRLATVFEREGQMDDALAQLVAAARVDPGNAGVYADLGKIHLLRKDAPRAREAFEQALQRNPKEKHHAQIGLAEAHIGLGELDRAEQLLREVSQETREGAKIHKLWGDIYHQRGLYKEAVEEYEAAKLMVEDAKPGVDALKTEDLFADYDDEKWKDMATASKASTDTALAERRKTHARRSGEQSKS